MVGSGSECAEAAAVVWRSSESGASVETFSHGECVASFDELGEVVDSVGIGEAG